MRPSVVLPMDEGCNVLSSAVLTLTPRPLVLRTLLFFLKRVTSSLTQFQEGSYDRVRTAASCTQFPHSAVRFFISKIVCVLTGVFLEGRAAGTDHGSDELCGVMTPDCAAPTPLVTTRQQ